MQLFGGFKNTSILSRVLILTLGAALLGACGQSGDTNGGDGTSNPSAAKSPIPKTGYHFANKYTIGGDPGWDSVSLDADARRLYVTHYANIEVLDADTGAIAGKIADTPGVHGFALVTKDGKGYASNGKADTVSVINLKTLKHTSEIKTGKKPNAIVYNPNDEKVYVSNDDSQDLTVIDTKTDKVVGTIPVGGAPGYSAFDDKGTLWTNLKDKNAFVAIDAKTMSVIKTTPIEDCKEPASMTFDSEKRRLFIGCENNVLSVIDPDSGNAVARLSINDHVDTIFFDPATKFLYVATGDGNLAIIHQDSADTYTPSENVKTMRGAKTMVMDPKTGKIFMPTVENVPDTATGPPVPIGTAAYTPGPFVVITIEK